MWISIFEAVAVSVASDVVATLLVGIGGHPDHVAVGRVALSCTSMDGGCGSMRTSPYYMRAGWPTWLTRTPNPEADAAVEEGIAAVFPEHMPRRRAVGVLSPDIVKCKIAAAKRYYTEFAFIDVDFGGISSDPAMMRYAVLVCWQRKRNMTAPTPCLRTASATPVSGNDNATKSGSVLMVHDYPRSLAAGSQAPSWTSRDRSRATLPRRYFHRVRGSFLQ